jgi:hypothetical protein
MNKVEINDKLSVYISIGQLIALVSIIAAAIWEYSKIKNDIYSLENKFLILERKYFSDAARIENTIHKNAKARSKQFGAIYKYLSLDGANKQNNSKLSALYDSLVASELDIDEN